MGVNSGSLEKHILEKYGKVTAEGIVESALDKVHMIEDMGYDNLVVSIKSSDVLMCVEAHELIAKQCPYPLHVGITEAGTVYSGNIKSSVGLGIILHEGIGNTIRVSLDRRPGGGSPHGKTDSEDTGTQKRRDRSCILSDLRPYKDRPDRSCRTGGKNGSRIFRWILK